MASFDGAIGFRKRNSPDAKVRPLVGYGEHKYDRMRRFRYGFDSNNWSNIFFAIFNVQKCD